MRPTRRAVTVLTALLATVALAGSALAGIVLAWTLIAGTAQAMGPPHVDGNEAGEPGAEPPPASPQPYPIFNPTDEWPLTDMHASSLWMTTRGSGVIVAVLDTGINMDQPDLTGALRHYKANLSGSADGGSDESATSHGTAIAGIIAGRGSTTSPGRMAGLAPQAFVLDIRISVQASPVSAETVALGIRLAVKHHASIINISLPVEKPEKPSLALARAVADATRHQCLIVASAGSKGTPQALVGYPQVLIVAASDKNSKPVPSNPAVGPFSLLAPGADIFSAGEPSGQGSSHGGYVRDQNGSGYAAAYVSAAAALLLKAKPGLTAIQAGNDLRSTARPVPGSSSGELDPAKALELVNPTPTPPPTTPPTTPPHPRAGGGSGFGAADVFLFLLVVAAMTVFGTGFVFWRLQRQDALTAAAERHSGASWGRW